MQSNRWTALTLLLTLATAGCSTTPSTVTTTDGPQTSTSKATTAAAPRYVLCSEDPPIGYNTPKAGQQDDRANAFDSPETVGDPKTRGTIRNHNTVVISACAPMYDKDKEAPAK